MSELSAKIAALKGPLTTKELIRKADVSRQTFRKIELGQSVKLSTLREIAKAMRVSPADWVELLVAWLKTEAGPDLPELWIEAKRPFHSAVHDRAESQVARAMMLFQALNNADRIEISKAMERPEVRACLPSINRVWEKVVGANSARVRRAVDQLTADSAAEGQQVAGRGEGASATPVPSPATPGKTNREDKVEPK